MRRREFIVGLGSAAACPVAARAQQGERVRRVGVLVPGAEDQAYQARIDAFRDGLAKLGWIEDRNLRIDVRFGGNDASRIRAYAMELTSLAPDAVVTQSGLVTREMQQQSRTIPIVITGAGDERKKVEMRFAHLKTHHSFDRMRLRGLSGARDEFYLAAIVQNLKTLAKHIWWPRPHEPAACAT
jgi:hypothetical protein